MKSFARCIAPRRPASSIDLLVRGQCVLRPGVPGLSERISVRSIVGRFLEHSRIYAFENGGDREVFIASADWMGRNLDGRVEIVTPVIDPMVAETIDGQILTVLFADNVKSRELLENGSYRRCVRRTRRNADRRAARISHSSPSHGLATVVLSGPLTGGRRTVYFDCGSLAFSTIFHSCGMTGCTDSR